MIRIRRNQQGLASIVIVAVLVALLGLISIGFARLMDRAVTGSLNNQLSSAASYAVQSGINDTIAYLQANPGAASSNCNSLFSTNGGADGKIVPTLSSSANGTYKYSCILVDTTPPSLQYGTPAIPASNSQSAAINPAGKASQMLFSWQSAGSGANQNANLPGGSPQLVSQNDWNRAGYEPMLRVTLYPVASDNSFSQSSARTYFLYPSNSGSNQVSWSGNPDGSRVAINCNSQPGGFTGSNKCNAAIVNLPSSAAYYYARMTPIYYQAKIEIQARDSSGAQLNFSGDQDLVDVTAQAGAASKRQQARVEVGSSQDVAPATGGAPEDSVRSAQTICKRLLVNSRTVRQQGSFCLNQPPINQPPPEVDFCVDNGSNCANNGYSPNTTTINDSDKATLRWNIDGADKGCTNTGSNLDWSNPTGDGSSSTQSDPLSGGTNGSQFTFELSCSNSTGTTTATVTVNVNPLKTDTIIPGTGGTQGSPGCDDITVNVDFDGSSYTASVSGTEGNTCGIGIAECNPYDGDEYSGDNHTLGEDDFGNGNPVSNGTPPGTTFVGCSAINGVRGYSGMVNGPAGGTPPTQSQGWVSRGISYYGVKGGEVSKGISSWCNDTAASHYYLVCGVYVTKNIDSCSLFWTTNGSTFQEHQYDGVTDTRTGLPTSPGFVLGFPGADYVVTNGVPPQLRVSCSNGISDWIWSPASYPVGT